MSDSPPPAGRGRERVARVPGAEVGDRGGERSVVGGGEGHGGVQATLAKRPFTTTLSHPTRAALALVRNP